MSKDDAPNGRIAIALAIVIFGFSSCSAVEHYANVQLQIAQLQQEER